MMLLAAIGIVAVIGLGWLAYRSLFLQSREPYREDLPLVWPAETSTTLPMPQVMRSTSRVCRVCGTPIRMRTHTGECLCPSHKGAA